MNRSMKAGTVSLRLQSRCSSQKSCGTLIILTSACSTRRSAASCAATEVPPTASALRSEEHTSELQSPCNLVCRLLLEKKKKELVNKVANNQNKYIRY